MKVPLIPLRSFCNQTLESASYIPTVEKDSTHVQRTMGKVVKNQEREVQRLLQSNCKADSEERALFFHNNISANNTSLLHLKKAGMASRNIDMKKQYTFFWISFAVALQ